MATMPKKNINTQRRKAWMAAFAAMTGKGRCVRVSAGWYYSVLVDFREFAFEGAGVEF